MGPVDLVDARLSACTCKQLQLLDAVHSVVASPACFDFVTSTLSRSVAALHTCTATWRA